MELYILEGEQNGARAEIKNNQSVIVGSDLDGDIVLRDAYEGQRIRFTVLGDFAQIEILSGNIEVKGVQYSINDVVNLVPYTPFNIGSASVAYGVRNEDRWKALKETISSEAKNEEILVSSTTDALKETSSFGRWRSIALLGVLLFSIGVGFVIVKANNGKIPQLVKTQAEVANDISKQLEMAGFSQLEVVEGNRGKFLIKGNLDTKVEHILLEKITERMDVLVNLQISIKEQLLDSVEEIYRVNGVKAEVQHLGPGIVQVNTEETNTQQLSRIVEIAKQDIKGLLEIIAENEEPAVKLEPEVIVDDPGKRVASVVPGNPAYLITVDGARYFVGAMMPSGHKISAISKQQVMLDKRGEVTTLEF